MAKLQRISFKIADMTCAACSMKLEALEDRLPGVTRIEASYHKGRMDVTFDPAVLDLGALRQAVARLGYTISAETPG